MHILMPLFQSISFSKFKFHSKSRCMHTPGVEGNEWVRYACSQHLEFLFKDRFQWNCEGEVERWWFPDSWSDPGAELPSRYPHIKFERQHACVLYAPPHHTLWWDISETIFWAPCPAFRYPCIKLNTRQYVLNTRTFFCHKYSEIRCRHYKCIERMCKIHYGLWRVTWIVLVEASIENFSKIFIKCIFSTSYQSNISALRFHTSQCSETPLAYHAAHMCYARIYCPISAGAMHVRCQYWANIRTMQGCWGRWEPGGALCWRQTLAFINAILLLGHLGAPFFSFYSMTEKYDSTSWGKWSECYLSVLWVYCTQSLPWVVSIGNRIAESWKNLAQKSPREALQ